MCAASLITSEFRTMMRKKLTNSQLITIRREMSEFVFPNFPTDVLLQIGTSDVYLFNDEYGDHWPLCCIMYLSKMMPLFTSCPPVGVVGPMAVERCLASTERFSPWQFTPGPASPMGAVHTWASHLAANGGNDAHLSPPQLRPMAAHLRLSPHTSPHLPPK